MMAGIFHASEIVEVAMRIEQNGGTFYGLLADKITDPLVKDLFLSLAAEEKKHFETFKEVLSRANLWEPLGSYAPEYRDYMECLASQSVFTIVEPQRFEKFATTPKDAIIHAQRMEKDSIIFYYEMRGYVPVAERDIIEKLIDEERKHFVQLVEIEKKLDSDA